MLKDLTNFSNLSVTFCFSNPAMTFIGPGFKAFYICPYDRYGFYEIKRELLKQFPDEVMTLRRNRNASHEYIFTMYSEDFLVNCLSDIVMGATAVRMFHGLLNRKPLINWLKGTGFVYKDKRICLKNSRTRVQG